MKKLPLALVSCLCLFVLKALSQAETASSDPYANETPAQRDARMEWWREARFGMFIHWGVYSVPAGTYQGKQVPGIGEWIMCNGKIPMAEYQKFAKEYNPTNFDADAWVKLAKEAGMKYIVITAKHHDGFANFATKASPWNIVDATPYAKDVLAPLAAACRKYGIKLGFYYSQAQDWNNGGSECAGPWDPAQKRSMDEYIDRVAVPQVRELLSNYGEFPAVIWWDTDCNMNQERASKLIALLKLKPGIIHNNRLGGGYRGDTETPEQTVPATGWPGRDWETCMTMNDTWGYKSYDHNWKSTETILRNLVDIASKGGNYLLNVGPDSLGEIPAPSIERLKAVGEWMKVNGESVYGTSATPFGQEFGKTVEGRDGYGGKVQVSSANAWRCTAKPGKLFIHFFEWPNGSFMLTNVDLQVTKAYLLADARQQPLPVNPVAHAVSIQLPAQAPDKIDSVLVLQLDGKPSQAVTQSPAEPTTKKIQE